MMRCPCGSLDVSAVGGGDGWQPQSAKVCSEQTYFRSKTFMTVPQKLVGVSNLHVRSGN